MFRLPLQVSIMLLLLLCPWRKVHAMSHSEPVNVGLLNVHVKVSKCRKNVSVLRYMRIHAPPFQPSSHLLTFVHIQRTPLLSPTLTEVMACTKATCLSCEAWWFHCAVWEQKPLNGCTAACSPSRSIHLPPGPCKHFPTITPPQLQGAFGLHLPGASPPGGHLILLIYRIGYIGY
jgi:hypothetical protein